jgi:hypothetical protein
MHLSVCNLQAAVGEEPQGWVCIDTRWHGPVGGLLMMCEWLLTSSHKSFLFFGVTNIFKTEITHRAFTEVWCTTQQLTCGTFSIRGDSCAHLSVE